MCRWLKILSCIFMKCYACISSQVPMFFSVFLGGMIKCQNIAMTETDISQYCWKSTGKNQDMECSYRLLEYPCTKNNYSDPYFEWKMYFINSIYKITVVHVYIHFGRDGWCENLIVNALALVFFFLFFIFLAFLVSWFVLLCHGITLSFLSSVLEIYWR